LIQSFDSSGLIRRILELEKKVQDSTDLRGRVIELERPGFISVVRLTYKSHDLVWRQGGEHIFILCDATDGLFSVQLPSAKATRGVILIFKKTDSTSNTVTVLPVFNELIDEKSNIVISHLNGGIELMSDGVIWRATGSAEENLWMRDTVNAYLHPSIETDAIYVDMIKLPGSISGVISIKAAASSYDTTYLLPYKDGNNGQVLTTDGIGNLDWVDPAGLSFSITQNLLLKSGSGGDTISASRIFDDGTNLGVNTQTPSAMLQMVKTANHNGILLDCYSDSTHIPSLSFRKSHQNTVGLSATIEDLLGGIYGYGVCYTSPAFTYVAGIEFKQISSGDFTHIEGDIIFYAGSGSAVPAETMRLSNTGLGIGGVRATDYTLTVNGNAKIGSLNGIVIGTDGVLSTITDNSANWDTAYGWGNHASGGYIKADGTVNFSANQSMNSHKITNLTNGVDGGDAVNKSQLDGVAAGLTHLKECISVLNTPPGSPTTGDRYVIGTSPTGAWSSDANHIAEYNGATWDFTTPSTGNTVWLTSSSYSVSWNGSIWAVVSGQYAHNNLSGLNVGDYKHLTAAEYTTFGNIGASAFHADAYFALATHYHYSLMAADGSPNPALSVDNSGQVGIGIVAPGAPLHVYAAASGAKIRIERNTSDAHSNIWDLNTSDPTGASVGSIVIKPVTKNADFIVSDKDFNIGLVVKSDLKIGIGTINPQTILHIDNNLNVDNVLLSLGYYAATADGTTRTAWAKYYATQGSNDTSWAIGAQGTAFAISYLGARATIPSDGEWIFTVLNNNRVGIGISEPTCTLDVAGSVKLAPSESDTVTIPYLGKGMVLMTDASTAGLLVTQDPANWNTAYGWGNHASGGYMKPDGTPHSNTTIVQSNGGINHLFKIYNSSSNADKTGRIEFNLGTTVGYITRYGNAHSTKPGDFEFDNSGNGNRCFTFRGNSGSTAQELFRLKYGYTGGVFSTNGGTDFWGFFGYSAGAPTPTGYIMLEDAAGANYKIAVEKL
jgi:hypothetical protein